MTRAETIVLTVIASIGYAAFYYWTDNSYAPLAFLMSAAFIGECTDAIIRRMDQLVTHLKKSN